MERTGDVIACNVHLLRIPNVASDHDIAQPSHLGSLFKMFKEHSYGILNGSGRVTCVSKAFQDQILTYVNIHFIGVCIVYSSLGLSWFLWFNGYIVSQHSVAHTGVNIASNIWKAGIVS